MYFTVKSRKTIAEALADQGFALRLPCGGKGRCGGCRVRLVSGDWSDHAALACQTRLTGESGVIDVPDHLLAAAPGPVERAWEKGRNFPETPHCICAVDLGSTTLAAVKIRNGELIASAGMYNVQSSFGSSVIDRIAACAEPGNLRKLHDVLHVSLAGLLQTLGSDGVDRIAVAGNTVETLLFHNLDPSSLGKFPFTPPALDFPVLQFQGIPLYTVRCISGFLGGDITGGVIESNLQPGELLIDVGTNCEMVFHTSSGWIGSSAAAGPAFEGSGIAASCRAVPGAVEHYFGNGRYFTIGEKLPPCGICGSAYPEILSAEFRSGNLDGFGRITDVTGRLEPAPGLVLEDRDVESILKAKAAIAAGIAALEKYAGETARCIVIAGGFGKSLNLKSCVEIGMFPDREFRVIGNSSLAGAARLAASADTAKAMAEYKVQTAQIREIPLANLPEFSRLYAENLKLKR